MCLREKGSTKLKEILLKRKVGKDGGKGLTVWRPVGIKLNNPGDSTVALQLLLTKDKIRAGHLDWDKSVDPKSERPEK